MKTKTIALFLAACVATAPLAAASHTKSTQSIGMCDFRKALEDSKYGQQEQNSLESIAKEMANGIEETEKKLQDLQQKMSDSDYLDSLSPDAEKDIQMQGQNLLQQRQAQIQQYQMLMQQGQMKLIETVRIHIMRAAQIVARDKGLDFVLDDNSAFYFKPESDVTDAVIAEMDKGYKQDMKENDSK